MPLYPININLEGRVCVVIGGGVVAARKVSGLVEAGALVKVISPVVVEAIERLASRSTICWSARDFASGDLRDAFLVYAATNNPSVQGEIRREADKYGILLNSADSPNDSDFHIPAHFRREDILITVATGGGSPALARFLRKKIEGDISVGYATASRLLGSLRKRILVRNHDSKKNGDLFRGLLADGLLEYLDADDWHGLAELLLHHLVDFLQEDGRAFDKDSIWLFLSDLRGGRYTV